MEAKLYQSSNNANVDDTGNNSDNKYVVTIAVADAIY